jgi:acetylornithine deacetylase/succinyl-diaminopimelate desuccinylase-like protein
MTDLAGNGKTDGRAAGAGAVVRIAQQPGVRECLDWFVKERRWINEKHLEICRIPAPTFFEQKRAEWMAEQFKAIGWISKLDRAGNVIATLNGDTEGRFVALTAHLDTVLAPRNDEEITVGGDGRFHGPGVSDNGAGLGALLAIARAAKSSVAMERLAARLMLIANVGEEGEGNLSGMRYLCRQSSLGPKIARFVVLDGPSMDHITCEALASRRYEISFIGPGGHSWSDYGIGNPVHAICRAVALFSDYRLNGGSRVSFNFGTIEGGISINSIPTQARAKLDLRSEDPQRITEMTAMLTAAVERALEAENSRATGGRVTAKIREVGSRPGGSLPESAAIVSHIKAVDQYLSIRSHLDCASTDANIPLSLGLQAISIGAGGQGGGAHTPSEWFHPEGREVGLKRILLTLCLLLGESEEG